MKIINPTQPEQPLAIRISTGSTPILFADSHKSSRCFWEFFIDVSDSLNTRETYLRAAFRFADWCSARGLSLIDIEPAHVELYKQELRKTLAVSTVRVHMSALKKLFDFLIVGQQIALNPISAVARPSENLKTGRTPHLEPEEMRQLFDSIELNNVTAYRDRAIIAVMAYSFARVTAVCGMSLSDYHTKGKRSYFTLEEKGGTYIEIPVHHTAQDYIDAYIDSSGITDQYTLPLFRSMEPYRARFITDQPMNRNSVWRMVKRRSAAAGLDRSITNHSFRATGITTYMLNGGTLENASKIAGHANPATTKLYDRSQLGVTLDEIERILY